ncbi:MAG TPA: alcohol dehydrogenase catalytic domain-containing protein [Thermoanaerobaculia bacterium]|nr:alcohol dehydrogenase catalytic domain-containing protein [Thermoanaerobaculia bacterium]
MGAISTSEVLTGELMTVAACADNGAVRLESRPRPMPGRGEILLRLRTAGLCGTDLFKILHGTVPAGTVLGHEVVGTVAALGPEAAGFLVGDRVVVPHHVACGECALCRRGAETLCPVFRENLLFPGGFSDHVLVAARAVRRAAFGLPDHLTDEAAVFLEPAACVLRGIRHARLAEIAQAGSPEILPPAVAILGGGSMGLLHLLVLKALFPDLRVAVSEPLEERRDLALRLGADAAAPPAEARAAVDAISGGLGADVAFDTVGGAGPLESALSLTREGGTVVLFAHAPASGPGERAGFALNPFFKSERKLIATYSSALTDQRDIYRLLITGRLDPSPLVTHRLPLSRLAEGIELARDLRALKVLLLPDQETS